MATTTTNYRAMGIPEIHVIDQQDSAHYRYENGELPRNNTFSHAAKGILFAITEIKNLLDD